VWADNILIKWKEPKDDGGVPIQHYVVEYKNMTKRGQSWTKAGKILHISFNFSQL